MSSNKIKKNQNNNKKNNPYNRKYYIAIAIMVAVIVAIAGFFIYESVSDKKDSGVKKVLFTMTDGQTFVMEVYPDVAPITVKNFLNLVEEGFYDGLTFHRVIEGFMAQGGAYDPINQMNDPAASIKGEFASNGFQNDLKHERGVVSMARTDDPNSASSQFFICYEAAPHLDGDYAAFGKVIEGMETVDSFLSAGTDPYTNMPLKEVKIKEAKIIN